MTWFPGVHCQYPHLICQIILLVNLVIDFVDVDQQIKIVIDESLIVDDLEKAPQSNSCLI